MRAIYALLVIVLILAGAVFETPAARAQTIDPETGVVLGEGLSGGWQRATACTLTLSPNVVTNGSVFTASISYSPNISGSWKEIFIFPWPSKVADFDETTIRTKTFKDEGSVSGSFEYVVAPGATNIAGTFRARVIVPGVCMATATMTVNNP